LGERLQLIALIYNLAAGFRAVDPVLLRVLGEVEVDRALLLDERDHHCANYQLGEK